MSNIGLLQEQGDLGLGFNPIENPVEQKKVQTEIANEHAQIKQQEEKTGNK